jgi:exonuclease V gamma subunit
MQVLGKLILFIENLQSIHQGLAAEKTMHDWLAFMQIEILDSLFDGSFNSSNNSSNNSKEHEFAINAIKSAIEQINANVNKACYTEKVSLSVAREAINSVLSKPDPLNQFNTGQVTFCSMIPMRSVPFKVVCILGLNDGVFPRTSQPLSVDLMTQDKALETDRSRRNEDRYMFLEAIISARHYLYLSYQGKDLKNNSDREPSLVLREFIDYLKQAFDCNPVYQHPLQPFSHKAFKASEQDSPIWAKRPSFANSWLKVANAKAEYQALGNCEFTIPSTLSVDELVRFFDDPIAAFSNQHLHLSFDRYVNAQSDVEPFSISGLTRYEINKSILESASGSSAHTFEASYEKLMQTGDLPKLTQGQQIDERLNELVNQAMPDYLASIDEGYSLKEFSYQLALDIQSPLANQGQLLRLHSSMPVDANYNSKIFLTRPFKLSMVLEFVLQHAIKRLHISKVAEEVQDKHCELQSEFSYIDIASLRSDYQKFITGQRKTEPKAKIVTLTLNDENFDLDCCQHQLEQTVYAYSQGMRSPSVMHTHYGALINKTLAKAVENEREPKAVFSELAEKVTNLLNDAAEQDNYLSYMFPSGIELDTTDIKNIARVFYDYFPVTFS